MKLEDFHIILNLPVRIFRRLVLSWYGMNTILPTGRIDLYYLQLPGAIIVLV